MTTFSKQRIIVPIDFSDDADRAVDVSLEIASVPSLVTAVHVAAPLATLEPGVVWEMMNDETRLKQLNEAFHKRYHDPQYSPIGFEVRFGDPGNEITSYAEEAKAGLIVMPSHGRTGLSHLLIGSVAERVVRLAHCPVLVLRQ